MKKKPSKQAKINTKNESIKGDSKGLTLQMERLLKVKEYEYLFRLISNNDSKKVGKYVKSNSIPFSDVILLMKYCMELFHDKGTMEILQWTSEERDIYEYKEIERNKSRKQGTASTKKAKEKKYSIAKEIFEFLKLNGEQLPIKRSQIETVIHTIWKKRTGIEPPKEKTLFAYQKKYLSENK